MLIRNLIRAVSQENQEKLVKSIQSLDDENTRDFFYKVFLYKMILSGNFDWLYSLLCFECKLTDKSLDDFIAHYLEIIKEGELMLNNDFLMNNEEFIYDVMFTSTSRFYAFFQEFGTVREISLDMLETLVDDQDLDTQIDFSQLKGMILKRFNNDFQDFIDLTQISELQILIETEMLEHLTYESADE